METAHSIKIFQEYTQKLPGRKRAFDIGCGIGRVTKFILSNVFDKVDLLDQSPAQISEAKNFLSSIE
jgi:trans-aconitate methyltransferase